jgi:hypothetical protein
LPVQCQFDLQCSTTAPQYQHHYHHPAGVVHIPDLSLIEIDSFEMVEKLMEKASRARSIAATDMNAHSSRSHSVFSIYIKGVHDGQGVVLEGPSLWKGDHLDMNRS